MPASILATQQPAMRVPNLEDFLAKLEAEGKVISAWVLPASNPARDLTLATSSVTTWAAAYGSQKVDLTEATNKPTWDATLFGNKGGVVFDGTNDVLSGTGNVTNWPTSTQDLYMLVGCRQDVASGTSGIKVALGYGFTSQWRYIGRTTSNKTRMGITSSAANGVKDFSGAHVVGAYFDLGGTSTLYLDGASDATVATTTEALTLTRVRMGALPDNTPAFFWTGVISSAVVLTSAATVRDFQTLSLAMQARLS